MVKVILEACDRRNLHSNTSVINSDRIDPIICIHIPEQYCIWYDVEELINDATGDNLSFERDRYTPWVSIPVDQLDLSIGFHSYSIKLVHRHNQVKYFWICFGYLAQSNNPETPYIYMDRSDPIEDESNNESDSSTEDENEINIF